jgi:hypothetical protein
MFGEERVSDARHSLLCEFRLTSAAFGRNQNKIIPTDGEAIPRIKLAMQTRN